MKPAKKLCKLPKSSWVAVVLALFVVSGAQAQQTSGPQKALHLMGLVGVKDNAKGTLHVEGGIARAMTSLPVPVSPVINTVEFVGATAST